MAQLTGTTIVARARVYAQDTSTSSPAVNDANALILLNNVLLKWTGDVASKHSIIAASASGLTFTAGTTVMETTATDDLWDHIYAAFESDTSGAEAVLPPPLREITVAEMLDLFNNDYSGTLPASGTSGWQAFAWERAAASTGITGAVVLRVYVWPSLNATRYLTLRVPKNVQLAALTDTPDISLREAEQVERLLAWEMARLQTEDDTFLQQILSPVPSDVLDRYFEGAKSHGWMQYGIRDTGALGG